jgi:hypothetical protein
MSDKKQAEKVVFNDDIYYQKKELDYSNIEKIIYVEYPELKTWGIVAVIFGLFLGGFAFGYNYGGGELASRIVGYFGVSMFVIVVLGIIMIYYSQDVYYKKVD